MFKLASKVVSGFVEMSQSAIPEMLMRFHLNNSVNQ